METPSTTPPRMWVQATVIPVEHLDVVIRIGANKRTGTSTVGVKVKDADTDDLIAMWHGTHQALDALEGRAAMVLAEVLKNLEIDQKSQDPF